jgi:hypothetical protein
MFFHGFSLSRQIPFIFLCFDRIDILGVNDAPTVRQYLNLYLFIQLSLELKSFRLRVEMRPMNDDLQLPVTPNERAKDTLIQTLEQMINIFKPD